CRDALRREAGLEQHITRKPHDPGELFGIAGAAVKRHRAALRETGEHNLAARDATLVLASNERLDYAVRGTNSRFILRRAALDADDVVPRPHPIAVVERHRPHRRVWKYKTQGALTGTYELRDDRLEVVTVRAQAVHPDNRADRVRARFYFNEILWHAREPRGSPPLASNGLRLEFPPPPRNVVAPIFRTFRG